MLVSRVRYQRKRHMQYLVCTLKCKQVAHAVSDFCTGAASDHHMLPTGSAHMFTCAC